MRSWENCHSCATLPKDLLRGKKKKRKTNIYSNNRVAKRVSFNFFPFRDSTEAERVFGAVVFCRPARLPRDIIPDHLSIGEGRVKKTKETLSSRSYHGLLSLNFCVNVRGKQEKFNIAIFTIKPIGIEGTKKPFFFNKIYKLISFWIEIFSLQ